MAIYQQQEQIPSSLFDALYCEEEHWEDEEDEIFEGTQNLTPSLLPILSLENEFLFEDEELISLFSKEQKQGILVVDDSLCCARREAVEWMLMVNTHFGFSTLTSILAVNYLDRFLSSFHLQNDKPWTMQLAAVSCLSLAAKVEETYVPLLVDLQVEGTKYMFEAKNIQKMELLVLSTLEWKMHPVTPLSFLDQIIRRLGLKNHLHWEFLKRCEKLLLSVLPDWRFVGCLPSVLATATMMRVIDQIEPCNPLEYQNQLMGVLKISKEKMNDCYQLIKEISSSATTIESNDNINESSKRKWEQMMINGSSSTYNNNNRESSSSPSGVIDASYNYLSCCDSSNDSWASTTTTTTTSNHNINNNAIALSLSSSSLTLSLSSSSSSPSRKKGRMMHEQQSMTPRVFFVDIIGSP